MLRHVFRRRLGQAALAYWAWPGGVHAQHRPGLELGVLPNLSARVLLAQYQPVREYLARELARPVQVSTAPRWREFHERTLAGQYDLIVTAAHLARLAQLDAGWRPLLSLTPDVQGLLATPVGKPLQRLEDLRGQALALSNPSSLVALRGLQWLADAGLRVGRDLRIVHTPTEDSVGQMLLRGDAAAALLSQGEFRALGEAVHSQLRTWPPFAQVPGFVFMANPAVPAAEAQTWREQLLRLGRGDELGKMYFAASGHNGLQPLAPGLLESMDSYLEATRHALAV